LSLLVIIHTSICVRTVSGTCNNASKPLMLVMFLQSFALCISQRHLQ
jgi:hypothetical protein